MSRSNKVKGQSEFYNNEKLIRISLFSPFSEVVWFQVIIVAVIFMSWIKVKFRQFFSISESNASV